MSNTKAHHRLNAADVRVAASVLEGITDRTPVIRSAALDRAAGVAVHVKAECFQRGGSFKLRGAYHRISALTTDERARGVVAASSGNHAQATAIAAGIVGTSALILMPHDAPAVKREGTERHGAEIVSYDRYSQDRDELLAALAEETGRIVVPPFDDPMIVAGQGTAALELFEDAGPLDVLVCPIGGGGLISGSGLVAASLDPPVRVVGVEPEAGDDVLRSVKAGRRVRIPVPETIADGLQLTSPGRITFPLIQRYVDEIVTVTDDQIVEAMRVIHEQLRIVAEPSGACALAAVLAGKIRGARSAGVILSGGNVDRERFRRLIG